MKKNGLYVMFPGDCKFRESKQEFILEARLMRGERGRVDPCEKCRAHCDYSSYHAALSKAFNNTGPIPLAKEGLFSRIRDYILRH